MKRLCLGLIRLYQLVISPVLPGACRYYPTCSEYARQAVERWGAAHGLWMAAGRLLRCHPLARGGFDPVPQPAEGFHKNCRLPA